LILRMAAYDDRLAGGAEEPRLAAALVAALADGAEHAHRRGIFRRDLKPGNGMLAPREAPDGEPDFTPRLTDFGLAKLLEAGTSPASCRNAWSPGEARQTSSSPRRRVGRWVCDEPQPGAEADCLRRVEAASGIALHRAAR
jgi:serine/threonine protein kinase